MIVDHNDHVGRRQERFFSVSRTKFATILYQQLEFETAGHKKGLQRPITVGGKNPRCLISTTNTVLAVSKCVKHDET